MSMSRLKSSIKRHNFILKEKLTGYKKEINRFYEIQGYKPNLKNPRSFSEKLLWKKFYDRNPLLPVTGDKYQVRKYLEKKLGVEKARELTVPLLHVTDNPNTIPFDELPESYIIKASHGSGWNLIVDGDKKTRDEIVDMCWKWLKTPYGFYKHEWAYQINKRKILIEPLLKDQEGKIPKDFKLYVFHGKCKMVHVDFDRFSGRSRSLFDEDWNFIPVTYQFKQGPVIEKPYNFSEMVALAEKLGQDFDYVRVDLYSIGNNIFIGELTHYPGSAMEIFNPQSFDFELGQNWKIVPKYWASK